MPRTKKDAKILNIKLATPINDQLEQFCEETGLNKNSSNYLYPRDFLLGIMRYIYEQY